MRVLIVTGSSGGHIFPAVALAEELEKMSVDLLLVLPQKSSEDKLPVAACNLRYIPAGFLSFNLSRKSIAGFICFLSGAWESFRLILKFKPDVVVGFGSLNTLALVFWAWLFRIKTIIHEQNVVCGKANRLLSKLVDRVAISFSQTRGNLNIADEKIVLTGNPLRRDLTRIEKKVALDFFNFQKEKFTILITGGSQGSHRLNSVCFEALANYPAKHNLQIIHICGVPDFGYLEDKYSSLNLSYKLFEFFKQMEYAYSIADLIICRSGATTIAEIVKFRVPAILVPYPFAYGHQLANAQVLSNLGSGEIIFDNNLSADSVGEKLQGYFAHPERLRMMAQAYQNMPDVFAARLLANAVISLNNV